MKELLFILIVVFASQTVSALSYRGAVEISPKGPVVAALQFSVFGNRIDQITANTTRLRQALESDILVKLRADSVVVDRIIENRQGTNATFLSVRALLSKSVYSDFLIRLWGFSANESTSGPSIWLNETRALLTAVGGSSMYIEVASVGPITTDTQFLRNCGPGGCLIAAVVGSMGLYVAVLLATLGSWWLLLWWRARQPFERKGRAGSAPY